MVPTEQLPLDVELDLARKARAGDVQARDRLYRHHMWIIPFAVNRVRRGRPSQGADLDDMEGYAALGLAKAMSLFDPDRGCRLSTYAVKAAVSHVLRGTGVPAEGRPRRRAASTMDPADMAEIFATDPPDYDAVSARAETAEILPRLPKRLALVLRLRHGIDDGRARSLEEVGKVLNLTRERVRQLEARAIAILRGEIPAERSRGRPILDPANEKRARARACWADRQERRRLILELRAGRDGEPPATIRRIAGIVGLSPSGVANILNEPASAAC